MTTVLGGHLKITHIVASLVLDILAGYEYVLLYLMSDNLDYGVVRATYVLEAA